MTEKVSLRERSKTARELVRVSWDDARAAHLVERARARRRRRAIARGAATSVVALAAIAVLAWWSGEGASTPGATPADRGAPVLAERVAPSGVLHLYDGSTATPLGEDTELVIGEVGSDAIVLELRRGGARFEVTPGLPRAFHVRAGTVTASVVGTVFTVRRDGEGASVEVEEGRVRVAWEPSQSETLGAGERGTFPRAAEPARAGSGDRSVPFAPDGIEGEGHGTETAVRTAEVPEPPEPAVLRTATPSIAGGAEGSRREPREEREAATEPAPAPEEPVAVRGWRALAEQGRFEEGYGLLLTDRAVLPSRDVEALMQAADVARLSGHPAESLAYLHRALDVGAGDPRAPMVAFTLGRVLLQQLGRPADAAGAFARCRSLAPEGSLASDALAREVEAWHRAGELERARELALEYLRLHPHGLRASAVRHYGGLE